MNEMQLLILAAGLGSRYGGCKQIDPVGPNREIILEYSLFDAWKSGFTGAVLVVRRGMDEGWLKEYLDQRLQGRLELDFVFQELSDLPGTTFSGSIDQRGKPWGTGHAVWSARRVIDKPFAVVNADDFYGRESYRLLADFLARTESDGIPVYALAGYRLAATLSPHGKVARGICQVDQVTGFLKAIEEQTDISLAPAGMPVINTDDGSRYELAGDTCVSLNAWGFTPALFTQLEEELRQFLHEHGDDRKREFFLPTAVSELMNRRQCRVRVLPTPATWFGMTYQEDHPLVRRHIMELIEQGAYPRKLWG